MEQLSLFVFLKLWYLTSMVHCPSTVYIHGTLVYVSKWDSVMGTVILSTASWKLLGVELGIVEMGYQKMAFTAHN